jgi:hypothetical protein
LLGGNNPVEEDRSVVSGFWFLVCECFAQKVRNATNGSWWMVQVQPTKAKTPINPAREALRRKNEIGLENRPKTHLGRRSLRRASRAASIKAVSFVGWTSTIHRLPSVVF